MAAAKSSGVSTSVSNVTGRSTYIASRLWACTTALPHPSPVHASSSPNSARRNRDRKSTRLNSSHLVISYAVFCLKKKNRRLNRHRYCLLYQLLHYASLYYVLYRDQD